MINLSDVALVVFTYNPGEIFDCWLERLQGQNSVPALKLIVDSESNDGCVQKAVKSGFELLNVSSSGFNHGGTRAHAMQYISENYPFCKYIVLMTHDALLEEPDSLFNLVQPLKKPKVAAVCGRQLPHLDANVHAKFLREFNYPAFSFVNGPKDISSKGIKACFLSDSYAAYDLSLYQKLKGFPQNVIFGEDMYFAAKAILSGYDIAYESSASVRHSHNYSLKEEFQRYFDIGVFHCQEGWILDSFGKPEGEGFRFLLAEIKFVGAYNPFRIPRVCLSVLFKYAGYLLGKHHELLSIKSRRRLSMFGAYWK